MSLDRAAALRQAEKLVRQGKLDQAIGEYFTVVADQPRDWTTANLLGDLLVRAGRLDEAIDQFARCADTLRSEGFFPKAGALYKKILKIRPQDDRALVQAGELASQQGLLADARTFLRAAAEGRRSRSDERGVLEIVVALGTLDRSDVAARTAGARARAELGDLPAAIRELSDVASWLLDEGREPEAIETLREVLRIEPGNAQATAELGRVLVSQGDLAGAAQYLGPDSANASPAIIAAAAESRIRSGDEGAALEMIDRLLAGGAEGASDAVVRLSTSLASEHPVSAFHAIERVVDACVAIKDWAGAASALRAFASVAPRHVPALVRLVDVCIDGNVDGGVVEAQALLAEAYLAEGAATEARLVAEDLVRRQPSEAAHLDRLKRALVLAGDPTPDETAADWLAEVAATSDDDLEAPAPMEQASAPDEAAPPAVEPWQSAPTPVEAGSVETADPPPVQESVPVPPTVKAAARRPLGPHAIDLDALLSGLEPAPPPRPEAPPNVELTVPLDDVKARTPLVQQPAPQSPPPPPAAPAAPSLDIDEVFRQMRDEAERTPEEAAELSFSRGRALYEAGAVLESIDPLRAAARVPTMRYAAAALLARAFRDRQQKDDAIEWLGHAADAPVRTSAERYTVLLQLADLLEATGETARALAVCLELQAESGDYADVSSRIARLTRVPGGG